MHRRSVQNRVQFHGAKLQLGSTDVFCSCVFQQHILVLYSALVQFEMAFPLVHTGCNEPLSLERSYSRARARLRAGILKYEYLLFLDSKCVWQRCAVHVWRKASISPSVGRLFAAFPSCEKGDNMTSFAVAGALPSYSNKEHVKLLNPFDDGGGGANNKENSNFVHSHQQQQHSLYRSHAGREEERNKRSVVMCVRVCVCC